MADPQVPGYTSIANTTGAFGLTVQNPTTLDQYTLVGGGGGGGGVTSIAPANATIVTTPNPIVATGTIARAAITGDVTIAAGSNAAVVAALQGFAVATATPTSGQYLVWNAGTSMWTATTAGGGPPTGSAGGDLAGSYPNPTLAAIGSATGPIGSTSTTPVVTIDTKGRVTALTSATITAAAVGGLTAANNLSDVADAGSSRFHLSIPTQSAVAAVAVANVNIASAPTTVDGYTLLANDEVLLTAQSTTSQNGIYLFSASGSALTRPNEFPIAGVVKRGRFCLVTNGTVYAGTTWALASTAAGLTIDTSPQVWTEVGGAASFGPTGNVRKGAIVPATGDYTAAQVTNAADKNSATTQTFSGIVNSSLGLASTGGISSGAMPSLSTIMTHVAALTVFGTPAGNGDQNTTGRDIVVTLALTTTTASTNTVTLQISPDNSTFTTALRWAVPNTVTGALSQSFQVTVKVGYWLAWTTNTGASISIAGTPTYY